MRDANGKHEAVVGRVEVEEHEVRPVGLVDARVPRVHVDAVHLHHPEERVARVDEREVDEPRLSFAAPRPCAELTRRDPVRHPLGRLLLEERAAREPFAPALHRERPVLQVRQEHVGDLVVIAEQVALRDAVVGEQHAVGRAQLHLRHARTAHRTFARFGIEYVPSGSCSPSRSTTSLRSARFAIQLTECRFSRIPARSSTWSCGTDVRSCTSANSPVWSSSTSHSGSSFHGCEAASCNARTGSTNAAGRGSVLLSSGPFHTIARTPRGRSTRAISGSATCLSNQWNACATNTPSTDASSSGIRSAEPASAVTPGTTRSSIARMLASGSTAVTSR